jgi:uncharacterized MAPEG superfamily protein
MTIAYWCVLAAGVMPFLFTAIAKGLGGRYNNRSPREWQAKLEGRPARAHAAHLNSFEAFPLFAAGVIIAHLRGLPQETINLLAIAFIVLRLAYGFIYIAGYPRTRSGVWALAFLCCVGLFVLRA